MPKNATNIELFPDIFAPDPPGADQDRVLSTTPPVDPRKVAIDEFDEANRKRAGFYASLKHLLVTRYNFGGKLGPTPSVPPTNGSDRKVLNGLSDKDKAFFLGVAGTLIARNQNDPNAGRILGRDETFVDPETDERLALARTFVSAVNSAVSDVNRDRGVYERTLTVLQEEGVKPQNGQTTVSVWARQLALVSERLVQLDIPAADDQFPFHARTALSQVLKGSVDGRADQIDIEVLDLEEGSQADILEANVRPLATIYCAAMLEELKFFMVADILAEQFTQGQLPVSRGPGGKHLYTYIREAPQRMTEVERRSLYARCFGVAQGSVEEKLPNREFADLWIRFLSNYSFHAREEGIQERRQSTGPQVLKSARDVAVNLSVHGWGFPHFAAVELQKLIKDVKEMLSDKANLAAWGAHDCWGLTERVAAAYGGGAVNSVRQRTMAQSGMRIIHWLADHHALLTSSQTRDLPIDSALLNEVESWLAVTGTNDSNVQRFSEPVSYQSQRTLPDFAPQSMTDFQAAFDKMNALPATQLPQA